MAVETEMKRVLRPVIQAFREYAAAQGWGPGDYKLYLRPNLEWGYIKVILVARRFPSQDPHENYNAVTDFIEERLKDEPHLKSATGVVLRTFDEVARGGLYQIPPSYFDADDL
jgi:hypothetical protein